MEQYNNSCALFSYVLFDESLSWLIICTVHDYFLVVGNIGFVSTVLDMEISSAYSEFQEFIEEMFELEHSQRLLEQVLYKSKEYSNARDGDRIDF